MGGEGAGPDVSPALEAEDHSLPTASKVMGELWMTAATELVLPTPESPWKRAPPSNDDVSLADT